MKLLCFIFGVGLLILSKVSANAELKEVDIKVLLLPKVCPRKVENGDYVRYHYYGMLEDGTYFDSSFDRGTSYGTYVGSGWLIPGMDASLVGSCINEHRLVTIPPHLAYGEEGTEDGEIPGNATILFNFVLLDIWNDKDQVQIESTFIPNDCSRHLEESDYVRYHYNGTLLNGKPFHSSYEEDSTYDTYIGQGWIIKGMDEGLLGACMGERRTIIIPPHKAYGEKGDEKNIPRSSSIRFDVEIIDFHNPKDEPQITTTSAVDDCKRKIEATDFVRYHYNGLLMDGTLFDSSYQRNRTYDTYVGMRKIIPGMEVGLLGACMGEQRTIVMPPHLGYGERGVAGKIPPSAVLKFEIHVVDFHNPLDDVVATTTLLPDRCLETDSRRAESGDFVSYDFEIKLVDGTLIESSSDRTGSWGVYLGRGEVVPGLDRGLVGVCVGEKRELTIPPHIAYGEPGREDPFIPGSAVLVVSVSIRDIEDSLPPGLQFEWKEEVVKSEDELFAEIDEDGNGGVSLPELTSFILNEVEAGRARLLPGFPREKVVTDIFENSDKNDDGKLEREEFSLKYRNSLGEKLADEL